MELLFAVHLYRVYYWSYNLSLLFTIWLEIFKGQKVLCFRGFVQTSKFLSSKLFIFPEEILFVANPW